MIEAIVAAGLAGAVTAFAMRMHDAKDKKESIEERIRSRVGDRIREYREQGRIDEQEYILLTNGSLDTVRRPEVADTNTLLVKILSRLDDIHAKIESKGVMVKAKDKDEDNKSKDKTIPRDKNKGRYKERRASIKDSIEFNTLNTDAKEVNDGNSSSSSSKDDYLNEFSEIEELKKQITEMISRLEKE